jgi:hypothetical protein
MPRSSFWASTSPFWWIGDSYFQAPTILLPVDVVILASQYPSGGVAKSDPHNGSLLKEGGL